LFSNFINFINFIQKLVGGFKHCLFSIIKKGCHPNPIAFVTFFPDGYIKPPTRKPFELLLPGETTVMAMATSYNWLFLWDYTFYKWAFVSTYNL